MLSGEELQKLSVLLRISARIVLKISGTRFEDRDQLDKLASDLDGLADTLMQIGSRKKHLQS